ncbi:ATP-binding protein [Methylocaldum sp. MU1018]
MTDLAEWQQNNDAYLSAALAWLRLRLRRLAEASAPAVPSAEAKRFGWWFGRRNRKPPESGGAQATTLEIDEAAKTMTTAEAVDPPPALPWLGRRFGLSRFEQEILLLCSAIELDTTVAGLCARAQDNPSRPYPTFALAMALFDDPAWDALSAERPLRYWRLLEINQPGATPLTVSALRADERIVNYVKGLNTLDDRLTPLLIPFDVEDDDQPLPLSQQAVMDSLVHHLKFAGLSGRPSAVQLVGADPISKQWIARRALSQLGLQPLRLFVDALPAQTAELEALARLWQRESILLPIALYLDASESGEMQPSEGQNPLGRFVRRLHGPAIVDTREVRAELGTDSLEFDKPASAEQRAAWSEALSSAAGDSAAQLAAQFNLDVPTIRQIALTVLADHPGETSTLHERLWETCLERTRPRLDKLAERIEPKARWDDLILPDEATALLREIAAQVGQRSTVYDTWGFRRKMNRGLGISALFAGESGCGKTMAAEVIANALRLNLYRIDLSAVVSKYIGETEKNLRRLFDVAERGGAILFFDEADALFGKRSEVKDSHDRYANIEINYLLQRMEAYRGLAILATNMKSALDQAFLRRLRFIVNFPFPGAAERRRIWERVFPPETPKDVLDYDRLARFNLTGGSIHNIALNAAFMAAQAKTGVSMPLIFEAARNEFRKLEKAINEADFRSLEAVGVKHEH